MKISVAPALWPGETFAEIRAVTEIAALVGIEEAWYSEVNGYDALVLSAALTASGAAGSMAVTVGPLPLGVRDPALLAMGLATIQASSEGPVRVALGTSTPTIVESWHGRQVGGPVKAMADYLPALREAAAGVRLTDRSGVGWRSDGFKLAVPGFERLSVTVAALGDGMLAFAGQHADRVVVNLVTPDLVRKMRDRVNLGAARVGRRPPDLAVWLMTGSRDHALGRAASLLRPYADAPGYSQVLDEMGMADLIRESPEQAAEQLGAFDHETLSMRLAAFEDAGADEVVVVVSGADPGAADSIARAKAVEVPK